MQNRSRSTRFTLGLALILSSLACKRFNDPQSQTSSEDLAKLPQTNTLMPSSLSGPGARLVPIDIQEARYQISFDIPHHKAEGTAQLTFVMQEGGYPILLFRNAPQSLTLDGEAQALGLWQEFSPDPKAESFAFIKKNLARGEHTLTIAFEVHTPFLQWDQGGLQLMTIGSDIRELGQKPDPMVSGFLEKYVPSNYEWDQFPSHYTFVLQGASHDHKVMSNASVALDAQGQWHVDTPASFNSSALWIHILDPKHFAVREGSISGLSRSLAFTLYAPISRAEDLPRAEDILRATLARLEANLGPFPHSRYIAGLHGPSEESMEYVGGAYSDLGTLDHEIAHSYFGRGVMPAKGRDGWLDEALATWVLYPAWPAGSLESLKGTVGSASPYDSLTDSQAYTVGPSLMAYLNSLRKDQGGLMPLLRRFAEANVGRTIAWESFRDFVIADTPDIQKDLVNAAFGRAIESPSTP